MENKIIRKQIRKISNTSTLPLLIFILLSEALTIGLRFLVRNCSESFPLLNDSGFVSLLIYIGLYLVIIPFAVFMFYMTRGKKVGLTFSSSFCKPKKSFGWCVTWIIIAIGFTYIASYVSNFISTFFELTTGFELNEPSITDGTSLFSILVMLIAPPIFAPLMEEFLFRGVIYRNSEPVSQWFAIIISGLMFGLWHTNYAQFLFTSVVGMFSAFIYAKTRSILPSIILHFIINTTSTTLQILLMNLGITDITGLTPELLTENLIALFVILLFGVFVIALIITAIILFIIQLASHHGRARLSGGYYLTSNANKFAGYFSAPITIIVFIIFIVQTITNAIGIG